MTMKISKASARLYAILARKAPIAVVFRRGPSKQVMLLLWHTDTDIFEEGQWLKGRIYERRCDLSPSGKRLIYFAASYKEPYRSWTAISKPPYLTATALWPKGDAWGGGGLFKSEHEIFLNHRHDEMSLGEGFKLPNGITIISLGEHSGWGEDSPIIDQRLLRDGWSLLQRGKHVKYNFDSPVRMAFNPTEIWAKANPKQNRPYDLREVTSGLHERDGSWYVTEHIIVDRSTEATISLGRTDWADWCSNGELLFAKDGIIYRLGFGKGGRLIPIEDAKLLIDLNDRKFEPKEAPAEAKTW